MSSSDTRRRSGGARPLLRYVAVRSAISVLLLWGVTLVTFTMTNLVPADPVQAVLGEQASNNPAIVEATRHRMGLDQPLPVQYGLYLRRLVHLDLGTSAQTHNPVLVDLQSAFPATMELATFVLVLSVLLGVGLGLVAALRHQRLADKVIRVGSLIGISLPTFWLATLAFYLFFYKLGALPGSGRLDAQFSPPPHVTGMYTVDAAMAGQWDVLANALWHLVLPGGVLTLYTVGVLVRFSRSAILEVAGQEYVLAARAKGLPGRRVTFGYVLRGALLPVLTMTGLTFGSLLSGSVLTESVFAWNGMGQYAYRATTSLDLQAVMGVGIVVGAVFIAANFVVDLLYGVIDPRVRLA
ncbi:ABC transporter permease [Pengzhenrongella sp.]|uniref:ABC transporter permease n=1 Tax=Pengzhenrongella sp. TaxID=2888820 RepID=UPI002F949FD8